MEMIACRIFFLYCMSLLIIKLVKSRHNLARIYFIFVKIHPKANLKFFKYEISTTGKISEQQLPSKAKVSIFLQLNCFSFKLKLWERP